MADQYRVLIRDNKLRWMAEIKDYASAEFIARMNRVGAATLTCDLGTPLRDYLDADLAGLVLIRNGVVLWAGPIISRPARVQGHRGTYAVQAVSDLWWLARTAAFPEAPLITTGNQEYDSRSGAFTDVLAQYIGDNCGPTAANSGVGPVGADTRRVYGLTVSPLAGDHVGTSIVGGDQVHFANLLQMCQVAASDISQGGQFNEPVFDLRHSAQGSIEFYTHSPVGSTSTYSFAHQNMLGYERVDQSDDANFVIMMGPGQGRNRYYHYQTASLPQVLRWGRGEITENLSGVPPRGIPFLNWADDMAYRALYEHVNHVDVSATLVDQNPSPFRRGSGDTYDLGDTVAVTVEGVNYQRQVREVKISIKGPEDVVVSPVIGSSQSSRAR